MTVVAGDVAVVDVVCVAGVTSVADDATVPRIPKMSAADWKGRAVVCQGCEEATQEAATYRYRRCFSSCSG